MNMKEFVDQQTLGTVTPLYLDARGPYPEAEDNLEAADQTFSEQFKAAGYLIIADHQTIVNFKGETQVIALNCLELNTTEIRNFLKLATESSWLATSKIFLLDIPSIEYQALRRTFAKQLNMS